MNRYILDNLPIQNYYRTTNSKACVEFLKRKLLLHLSLFHFGRINVLFLSDSSLVAIYLEVVCEDCEIDLHTFHGTTLPQLPLFYDMSVLKVQIALGP